uniref:Uncharacterized protein n=1 Tax=Rhodopseudomonas palustris (strain BisA53) TaxID=316055 RepID=Q07NA7_RHOP5
MGALALVTMSDSDPIAIPIAPKTIAKLEGKRAPNPLATRLPLLVTGLVLVVAAVRFVGGAGATRTDAIAAEEIARRAAATRSLAPVPLARLPTAGQQAQLVAMKLPDPDRAALAADLAADRIRLVSLAFVDSDAEDGDLVTVRSGGFSQPLALTKAPVAITIPAPPDGLVHVIGTADGGGGITVGLVTGRGPVALGVLSVGQEITVPVVVAGE